jgi:ornithine carbamoyltransferase
MWQRFTERARRVVFLAQEEAGRLGENYVSTEHLLLGLVRESDSAAVKVLDQMGIGIAQIRSEIEKHVTRGDGTLGQDMQLTPRAKRVIDLAYDEARSLQNDFIGTEHLLLGLIREAEGLGGRVLDELGAELHKARSIVLELQGKNKNPGRSAAWKPEAGATMHGRSVVDIAGLSRAEIDAVFDVTRRFKTQEMPPNEQRKVLECKALAMIFEKPSLRTRVSFEVGIFQLGGHGIYLAPSDISLGKRESVADVARNLGRMCDIIMARVFEHEKVTELAAFAGVPVINGLSDLEHPCQALADFYTILEKKGGLQGLKLAFIGDGNNVAHSLMLLAAKVGTDFSIGCPEGYEPQEAVVSMARAFAEETGAVIEIVRDPAEAARGADAIYTDVWASMGQEAEAEARAKVFAPYQVNAELMKHAKPDAIFMHCLPAHRGSEVTDDVIDSPQSVVFDEAENRLHAQKGLMALLAG